MKTRHVALAVLMVLAFTGAWTTNKSSGTKQTTFAFATTGNVIPDSAAAGRTFISVADLAGTGAATLLVYGKDFDGDSTLVTLGGGASWETNAPHGIDSVVVVTNATILGFHVTN